MHDEQLCAATVGELKQWNKPVELADYDPQWPRLFEPDPGGSYGPYSF
jgi:hypothetical protein